MAANGAARAALSPARSLACSHADEFARCHFPFFSSISSPTAAGRDTGGGHGGRGGERVAPARSWGRLGRLSVCEGEGEGERGKKPGAHNDTGGGGGGGGDGEICM